MNTERINLDSDDSKKMIKFQKLGDHQNLSDLSNTLENDKITNTYWTPTNFNESYFLNLQ